MSDPTPATLRERLYRLADADPERVLVRYRRRLLTRRDTVALLESLGEAVGPLGSRRVVVLLPDGFAAYITHLYLSTEGATAVPQPPTIPPARLEMIARRVQAELLITTPALARKFADLNMGCPVAVANEGDSGGLEWALSSAPYESVPPQDVRALLFTSGSTGEPKGVCLGDGAIASAAEINAKLLGLGPASRSLLTVPLFDYYGLIQIYSHLLARAELVIGESVAFPERVMTQLREVSATTLVSVPYGLNRLFRGAVGKGAPSLCTVASSSEMLSSDVQAWIFRACRDAELVDVYGLTEAGRACSRRLHEPAQENEFVGISSPGVSIDSAGDEADPGELSITGSTVMLGYMTGVVDGQIRFARQESVPTGDLGYVDQAGRVHIVGRRDHLLNIRGDKIHPVEIEAIALEFSSVHDARAHLETGEDLQVVLEVVAKDESVDVAALTKALRSRLPLQFVPSRIDKVAALPRTVLGSKTIRN